MMDHRRTNLQKVRDYTANHPELRAAHHFLYDLPLQKNNVSVEFITVGKNPGESIDDLQIALGPTEESFEHDFHEIGGRSRWSKRWRDRVVAICGTDSVIQTQLFFWSSRNSKQFVERYGRLKDSPHLPFCIEMNRRLIQLHRPAAVIVSGLSDLALVADTYELVRANSAVYDDGDRVLEHFTDGSIAWIFTKHLTASWGFTKRQRDMIAEYVVQLP